MTRSESPAAVPEQNHTVQAALVADPDNTDLQLAYARQLRQAACYAQAVDVLRPLLRKAPHHVDALLELGGLLMLQGQVGLAQRCYVRLLRHQNVDSPLYPLALFNLAQALEEQGHLQQALQAYEAVLRREPSDTADIRVLYHQAFLRLTLCDWQNYDERISQLQTRLTEHLKQDDVAQPALAPLRLLSFPVPLALHTCVARRWSRHISSAMAPWRAAAPPTRSPGVIRVGYLSADFRQHAMGGLIHGLFRHHNRAQFEVFAYALVDVADVYTASVQRGADHFRQMQADSPQTIVQRIRDDGIDVLIDLMGYTHLSRPEVLALRAAPIQLHYLGYPGVLAADFIDGVIADDWLIPAHLQAHYREPVHRLPCGFVWSPPPQGLPSPSAALPARADHGLPVDGVVYACFNRAHKLDPHTFALWMDILQQVSGSVLWLIQQDPQAQTRLREAAMAASVDAARLVFSAPVPAADFAGLCALADLMLDTTHYGAGATGVAALRAGLPLLTCPGDSFASRMGASLCAATGLQELICVSLSAYRDKAIALGREPSTLKRYRRHLIEKGDQLPLFQTAAWVRSLEALLLSLVTHRPSPSMTPISTFTTNETATASTPQAFAHWLKLHDTSLAFSTYRANRLMFVGRTDSGQLKLHERLFDRPMGLFVQDDLQQGRRGQSLWMAGRSQVWRLDNLLEPDQLHEGGDRLYVPAACFTTGEVNAHEIVLTPDEHGTSQPLFVNTAFSCLARLQPGVSFAPTWQPSFISQLTPDDRCHLNGLAVVDGVPTWATACGSSDTPAGWRDHRAGGGVVLHIPTNRIVATGLSMPHSPRWHQGKLWLLNSGTGELGWIDTRRQESERFVPLSFVPGFVRGLAFVGDGANACAVVGLSKLRSPQFTGLPLEQRLNDMGLPGGCCGLRVIDMATGTVLHTLDLPEPIDELFDVVALPGVRQPRALGLQGEDIHCLVKLPGRASLTTIRPKAPSGNPHQAKPPPVFGVPVALAAQLDHAAQETVGLPIRYQQVFQLTPQTLAPYAAMTFPSLAPGSPRLMRVTGELLAVSAMTDGTMVGMAIAERHTDGSANLISLMVQPDMRRRGVATRMVANLQKFLAREGVRELRVRYHTHASSYVTSNASSNAKIEPLLRRLAWAVPRTDFVLIQSSADLLATTGWNTRFPLTAPYSLFPWLQATPDDLAVAPGLDAPAQLLPPASNQGLEPSVSLGLRCHGALVGWLIAHRVDDHTVRYSSLYVAPAHRARARGLALLAEGFCRQHEAGIPRAKAAIAWDTPDSSAFLRVQQRHLLPFLTGLGQSRSSLIRLTVQG